MHEAFLKKYYERAALTPYENESLMLTALRSGGLDAAFMDSLRAAFWLRGADSRGCCVMLGQPITDRGGLSKGLAMMVDKTRPDVTAAFDRALDVLDEKSETARIVARYLPAIN
jgi:polar amino acid transport system substrate-binding protein